MCRSNCASAWSAVAVRSLMAWDSGFCGGRWWGVGRGSRQWIMKEEDGWSRGCKHRHKEGRASRHTCAFVDTVGALCVGLDGQPAGGGVVANRCRGQVCTCAFHQDGPRANTINPHPQPRPAPAQTHPQSAAPAPRFGRSVRVGRMPHAPKHTQTMQLITYHGACLASIEARPPGLFWVTARPPRPDMHGLRCQYRGVRPMGMVNPIDGGRSMPWN